MYIYMYIYIYIYDTCIKSNFRQISYFQRISNETKYKIWNQFTQFWGSQNNINKQWKITKTQHLKIAWNTFLFNMIE